MSNRPEGDKNVKVTYRSMDDNKHLTDKDIRKKKMANSFSKILKEDPQFISDMLQHNEVSFNKEWGVGLHKINVYQFDSMMLTIFITLFVVPVVIFTPVYVSVFLVIIFNALILKAIPGFSSQHYKNVNKSLDDFHAGKSQ